MTGEESLMRCGITLYIQNYQDWNRYEAIERGEAAPALDPQSDVKRFMEEIDTALKLEEQGFDSLWTVEHHVSPYTMTTNPLQLLTYFAGATKKIDFGTMVVVVPWHHPLRLAEDMTMLHNLIGPNRKLIVGFGRGAARREFRQLNVDMNESRDRMLEGIQVIRKAITEEMFSFQGEYYNYEGVTMRPRPRDGGQLAGDMSYAWGSPTSAAVGAKLGLHPLIIPQKAWSEYHAELEDFHRERVGMGYDAVRPRIHMSAICAETEEEAEQLVRHYLPQYTDSATRNYELGSKHFKNVKGYEHYAEMSDNVSGLSEMAQKLAETYIQNHVWGTPDQCIRKLQQITEDFHPEEFMLVTRFGNMPKDTAAKSTDLIAREVLPAIHEIELQAPISYAESA